MASINFNAAEVEPSQEFQILPEGKYEAVIADSDVKETRSGSGRYVQIEFEVIPRVVIWRYGLLHTLLRRPQNVWFVFTIMMDPDSRNPSF